VEHCSDELIPVSDSVSYLGTILLGLEVPSSVRSLSIESNVGFTVSQFAVPE